MGANGGEYQYEVYLEYKSELCYRYLAEQEFPGFFERHSAFGRAWKENQDECVSMVYVSRKGEINELCDVRILNQM